VSGKKVYRSDSSFRDGSMICANEDTFIGTPGCHLRDNGSQSAVYSKTSTLLKNTRDYRSHIDCLTPDKTVVTSSVRKAEQTHRDVDSKLYRN